MTHVLLATSSVHTTAAGCDYLARRSDVEAVVVLGVVEPGYSERDVGDATNVAGTRLVEPTVETVIESGDPAPIIQQQAADHAVDEIVVGACRGDPESGSEPPGSTVRTLLSTAERPVVVCPDPTP